MVIHRIPVLLAVSLILSSPLVPPTDAAETPAPLALGSSIPSADVKMKGVDGREVSIADVRGAKGTLVIFSCNECPFVKAWEERLVAIGNRFSKRGFGVIVVNSNDPSVVPGDGYDGMVARAKVRGMAFPYVVDATSDVARAFGATRTPEAFLFDRDGRLVYHGAIDDNRDAKAVKKRHLENALQSVAGGRAVAVAETKSIGCTIKFRAGS
jgi:alkyl hydroperoxide reductase subunit AhpC